MTAKVYKIALVLSGETYTALLRLNEKDYRLRCEFEDSKGQKASGKKLAMLCKHLFNTKKSFVVWVREHALATLDVNGGKQ